MATLTIRNLDDRLKGRLRVRAATRGRSMEEEARQILRAALNEPDAAPGSLADRIRSRFARLGDVVLPIAEREAARYAALPTDAATGRARKSGARATRTGRR